MNEEKIKFIVNYKFNPFILKRIKNKLNIEDKYLYYLEQGLKDYFIARLIYFKTGKSVTMPSLFVDELWHEFILFTQDYHDFCNNVYKEYLHHEPYGVFELKNSDDEGLKNLLNVYDDFKFYRYYGITEIDIYNQNKEDFYLLFNLDYLIHNTEIEKSYLLSLEDIKGKI